MQKLLFRIDGNDAVARDVYRLRLVPAAASSATGIVAGECAPVRPLALHSGQFVDIALDGFFLRRPISVCDCTGDSLTLLYKVVGEGTAKMALMQPGETLELLTDLGNGFSPEKCREKALLAGGGLGAAPLFLLCRELLSMGKQVTVALGFNTAEDIILENEYKALGLTPLIATMDGSRGVKGFVTDAIREAAPEFDYFYTCGPLKMMQAVCAALPTPGEASLEERMGCGAGFCYGCTCHTSDGPRRVCKDGPVFKKEDIVW